MSSDLRTGLFLSPDFPSETVLAGKIFMLDADPVEFQALLMGAFSLLFNADNFQEFGDMTEEESAQYFRNMEVLDIMGSLCDYIVLNCLSEQGFVDAIIDKLLENGIGGGGSGGQNEPVTGLVDGVIAVSDCSANNHYGICLKVVASFDTQFRDALEKIQELLTVADIASGLASSIPIIGGVIEAAVQVATLFKDVYGVLYESAYNVSVQDALACRLYCMTIDSCEITLGDIINAYNSYQVDPLPLTATWVELIQWLYENYNVLDISLVASAHLLVAEAYLHGSAWFGIDQRGLELALYDAPSAPPPSGCECSDTWCRILDLSDGFAYDFSTTTDNTMGVLSGSVVVSSTASGAGVGKVTGIAWQVDFPFSVEVTSARIVGNATQGTGTAGTDYAGRVFLMIGSSVEYDSEVIGSPSFGSFDETYDTGETLSNAVRFIQVLDNTGGTPSGSGELTQLILTGNGFNPFGLDNC